MLTTYISDVGVIRYDVSKRCILKEGELSIDSTKMCRSQKQAYIIIVIQME